MHGGGKGVSILKETLWISNVNCVKVVDMMCVNIIMVVITVSEGGKVGGVTFVSTLNRYRNSSR